MNFKEWLNDDDEAYEYLGDVKEWNAGQLAILNHSSFYDISVVKIVRFEDVIANSDDYEITGADTAHKHNPFGGMNYKKGESVPIQTIKSYGYHANRQEEFRFVGPQNLYRTIDDLVSKELKVVYPDLIITYWNSNNYKNLVRDFPNLKNRSKSLLDQIEYHPFEMYGLNVFVLMCPRAMKHEAELKKTGYPHPIGKYYFAIFTGKEVSRSQELGFRELFKTVQEAANAADKYISKNLYGET